MSSLSNFTPLFSNRMRRTSFSVSAMTLSMSTPIINYASRGLAAAYYQHHPGQDYKHAPGYRRKCWNLPEEHVCQKYPGYRLNISQYARLLRRDVPDALEIHSQ